MKFFVSLLLVLSSANAFSYDVDYSKWKVLEDNENLKLYSHKEVKGYKLSVQLKKAHYKEWYKAKGDEVYKNILDKKKSMLGLLGIRDWKVSKKNWSPNKSLSTLVVIGTYTNSRDQLVEFKEVHEFSYGEKRQYLFTKVIPK